MQNIIAVIWDFDKTLVNGYMQDPILSEYNIEPKKFWHEVNDAISRYNKSGIVVNPDTFYLNYFIRKIKDGTFKGLTNEKLKGFGTKQHFYPGIPAIFDLTKNILLPSEGASLEGSALQDDTDGSEDHTMRYAAYGVQVEHYIVSTGFKKVIEGSEVYPLVEDVWGCELLEDGDILEVGYSVDNTSKTRALFEINKGVNAKQLKNRGINLSVNNKLTDDQRRVDFRNMIYIADGPSDVPAFSLIKKNGGTTFAIYPANDAKALKQVETLREDGRVDMFAEADYTEGKTAHLWLCNKIRELADAIVDKEMAKIQGVNATPKHLV